MNEYTQTEIDMANKGYAYRKFSVGGSGLRPIVKNLNNQKREDILFDMPAYEAMMSGHVVDAIS